MGPINGQAVNILGAVSQRAFPSRLTNRIIVSPACNHPPRARLFNSIYLPARSTLRIAMTAPYRALLTLPTTPHPPAS